MAKTERVLITAGGSGIGHAMATAFSDAGARVWITDVDEALLERAPRHWRTSAANACDEDQMSAVVNRVVDRWGGIDTLCANAGIAGPTSAIENIAIDAWRACVAVNLEGAFLAVKHATPVMKRARGGNLIFTASTAGLHGFPQRAPYAAAKWAVIGLMKTAAMELGPFGIRANAICPGCVEGDRIDGVIEREAAAKNVPADRIRDAYQSGTSLRRFVTAEDVAHMAVFLASAGARNVSGQIIAVDGHTENPDPKV